MNTFEHIIQTKSFDQLTSDEFDTIKDLVANEEEFSQMKAFFGNLAEVKSEEQFVPSASLKSSLDQVFQAKHPGILNEWNAKKEVETPFIPIYQRNWFRIAAVFILFLVAVPFFYYNMNEDKHQVQTASKQPIKQQVDQKKRIETKTKEEQIEPTTTPTPVLIAALPNAEKSSFENKSIAEDMASEGESLMMNEPPLISYKERGMSADLFFNSSKDLASKSFAQPVSPKDLLELITPAF